MKLTTTISLIAILTLAVSSASARPFRSLAIEARQEAPGLLDALSDALPDKEEMKDALPDLGALLPDKEEIKDALPDLGALLPDKEEPEPSTPEPEPVKDEPTPAPVHPPEPVKQEPEPPKHEPEPVKHEPEPPKHEPTPAPYHPPEPVKHEPEPPKHEPTPAPYHPPEPVKHEPAPAPAPMTMPKCEPVKEHDEYYATDKECPPRHPEDMPHPQGYRLDYGPMCGASKAFVSMSTHDVQTYDLMACAKMCDDAPPHYEGGMCKYFNMWEGEVERGMKKAMYTCSLYYEQLTRDNATNYGDPTMMMKVVNSRAYMKI